MGIFSFWRKKSLQTNTETTDNVFPHSMPEDIRQILKNLAQNHSEAFMKKLAQEKPDFNGQASDIQYIAVLLHNDVMASLQNERLREYIYEGTTPQEIPTLQSIAPIQVPPVIETYQTPSAWTYSALSAVCAGICFVVLGPLGFGRNTEVCLASSLIGALIAPAVGVWFTFGETRITWARTLLAGCMISDAIISQLVKNFQISTFWKESASQSLKSRLCLGLILWFFLGLLKRKSTVDKEQLHIDIQTQYLNQLCCIVSFLKMTCLRFMEKDGRIIALNEEIQRLQGIVASQGDLPKYASQAVQEVQGLWKTSSISQAACHARAISQYFSLMGFANIPTGTQLPWEQEKPDGPKPSSTPTERKIIIWDPSLENKYQTIGLVLDGEKVEVRSEPVELNGIITQKGIVYSLD